MFLVCFEIEGFEIRGFYEIDRCGVDAVAKARWFRAVWKYVSEVTAAPVAVDLRALHAVAYVHGFANVLLFDRVVEAWPAGS